MPAMRTPQRLTADLRTSRPGRQAHHSGHLVRFTHVFASAVRELLELKLLAAVTRAPLSLSQFHLLRAVTLDGHFHTGELADFLGVSAAAGTKNIDKLERLGYVVRHPSRCDRRVTLLSASRKGRRLVARYESRKSQSLSPVLARFSREELRQLGRLLERFTLSLIEQQDGGSGLCLYCAAYCIADCPVGRLRGGCPFERLGRAHRAGSKGGRAP